MRQLWDWKGSADVDAMDAAGDGALRADVRLDARPCPRPLRRRVAIAGYLGRGDTFDRAIARFAEAYADQNERDHRALEQAIASGRVTAQSGV